MLSAQPVFSIKPILRFGTILLVYIVLGAVVTCAALMLANVVGALFTSYPAIGVAAGVLLWVGAVAVFTWKLLDNYARIRYDLYPDRLEERGSTPRTIPYAQLGHLAFDGHQTLMLYPAFEGTTPRYPLRIDVPPGQGGEYFKRIVQLVKRADPQRLFSYAIGNEVQYSIPPASIVALDAVPVHRLVVKPDEGGRRDILVDDSSEPAYTVLTLSPAGKRSRVPGDLVVVNYTRPGEVVSAPLLVVNPSETGESNLAWQVYSVWNGQGVLVGKLRQKIQLPTAVHLQVELLDRMLTLDDNAAGGTLKVLTGDQIIGALAQAPHVLEDIDTLTLDQPLGRVPALALVLAWIRAQGY